MMRAAVWPCRRAEGRRTGSARPAAAGRVVRPWAATLCLLGAAHAARGGPAPDPTACVQQLADAQRAFDQGISLRGANPTQAVAMFQQAAAGFAAVIDAGIRNGRLEYNLANSHLELGDLGRAILHYRRALRLLPGDERIKANLRFARTLRQNNIADRPEQAFLRTFFFWHYALPVRARYAAAVTLYLVFWIALGCRVVLGRGRAAWLRWCAAVALLLALAAGVSVAIDCSAASRQPEGVILVDHVIARKGNGDSFEPQFNEPLHQGVEFLLIERRNDWLHVELPDGKRGWIQAGQAELI